MELHLSLSLSTLPVMNAINLFSDDGGGSIGGEGSGDQSAGGGGD